MHAGNDIEPDQDHELEALSQRFVASSGTDPDAVVVPRTGNAGHTQVETLFSLEPELDAAEVESLAGVSPDVLDKVTRALGLPASTESGRLYTYADVDLVRGAWDIVATFPDREVGFRLLRVVASSLARSAEAAVAAYNDAVQRPLWEKRVTRLRHARAQAAAIRNIKQFSDQLGTLFLHHSAAAVRRARVARLQSSDLDSSVMAVGFVDVVGFTPMSHELPITELVDFIAEFETLAFETAVDHGGMIVKHVGDEVMFVAIDPVAACGIAISLVERARSSSSITPHAGVAYGNLISSGGDYYGVEVNLAARLADVAVPYEVLASTELAVETQRRSDAFGFEAAGRRSLKGFPDPVDVFSLLRS